MPIRTMRQNDLPEVALLLAELSDSIGESERIDVLRIAEHFHAMQKDEKTYHNIVYEEEGRIVGLASLLVYRSFLHAQGTVLLNELVVSKDRRGKGIGKLLIEYCMAFARGRNMDELEVGVMKENERAIEFYRANGLDQEYALLGIEFDYGA